MKTLQELEKQLIDNRLMKTYEETALYEEAVDNIFNEEDSNVIYTLIKGFHDNTENQEVMYSNLHGIEFFSKKINLENYIQIILPLLRNMKNDAYNWAETFFLRLLNNEQAYEILKNKLSVQAKEDKSFIKEIVQNLINRNPIKFEAKAAPILKILI